MKSSAEIERPGLSRGQVEQFIQQGFIKVEAAFSREIAAEARALLWQLTGCDPQDPSTWTLPVVRLGDCAQEPFRAAVNTGVLHAAFDQLVGPGQWLPRQSLGGFPIRFPHLDDPGDSGWHVDASFPPDNPSSHYFEWRINIQSRERALLMLFLFSDVDEQDAPTRIRIGSHLRVARLLAPAGITGMSFMELAATVDQATADLPETTATGAAGTVYLCHPFLVHAAQPIRGTKVRFLAQPPLPLRGGFDLTRPFAELAPVAQAIVFGLGRS